MADYWLINGKTDLVRRSRTKHTKGEIMAKKRKHKKNDPGPRRHKKYYDNPGLKMGAVMGDLGVALVAGGGAYLVSRMGSKWVGNVLPVAIPQHELVSALVTSLLIIGASEMFIKSPSQRVAIAAGGSVPLLESLVNMTGMGGTLGTQRVLMLPAPPAAGTSAALQASLDAPWENEY